MRGQPQHHTLQPTALVHEAYLRLVDLPEAQWEGRRHFLGVAAKAMRAVLVDHARGRLTQKRGEGQKPMSLDENDISTDDTTTVLALHEALNDLARIDEPLARLVELRFFGGMTVEEAAQVLDVSPRTVKRGWRTAKAWLQRALDPEDAP